MKIDPNAPAFPVHVPPDATVEYPHVANGLTIRAYFAAMAMGAALSGEVRDPTKSAEWCVKQADALIAALNAEPKS